MNIDKKYKLGLYIMIVVLSAYLRKNIFNLNLIDFPPNKNIILALEILVMKKCIQLFYYDQNKLDSFDKLEKYLDAKYSKDNIMVDPSAIIKNLSFKITNYGKKLISHPFDVDLAHFYEKCVNSKIGYYGSIIVSMVSQENYNFMNGKSNDKLDIKYLIETFEEFKKAENKTALCSKKGIPYKGLDTAERIVKTLDFSKEGDLDLLERVFSKSFEHNLYA